MQTYIIASFARLIVTEIVHMFYLKSSINLIAYHYKKSNELTTELSIKSVRKWVDTKNLATESLI